MSSTLRQRVFLVFILMATLVVFGCKADKESDEGESPAGQEGDAGGAAAGGGGTSASGAAHGDLSAAAELLGVDIGGFAQEAPVGNFATLSVTGEAGKFEPLAVDSLDVEVRIEGRLARTQVTQVFRNHQGRQAEGTYEFTLPEGASISRLAMDVEGKMMEGELVERERAREIYESIVRRRKDPALLEWQGGNRFKTQIFPIPAKGTKTVVLAYEELLPESREGLRYRYSLPVLQGADNAKDLGNFKFGLTTAGKRQVAVEGYKASVGATATGGSEVTFATGDFVPTGPLTVRFEGKRTQEARVLYGKRVPVQVAAPDTQVAPLPADRFMAVDIVPVVPALSDNTSRNVVVALDTSAGIGQRVLDQARLATLLLVDRVAEDKEWRIVHGDYTVQTCEAGSDPVPCLKGLSAGGATDIDGLLSRAVEEAGKLKGPTAVVLLSDGVASLGLLDGDVIRGRVQAALKNHPGVSLHTVAIGHSPSEGDLELLASAGHGHSLRMTPVDSPDESANQIAERIQEPVLRDVSLKVVKGDISGFTPAVPTSLERGQAIMALGKMSGDQATLMIEATYAGEKLQQTVNLNWKTPQQDTTVVANFWARGWIEDMHRRGVNTADVVDHSLKYGVMSPYTSFLVLENDEAYKRFNVERRKEEERTREQEQQANLKKSDEDLKDVLDKKTVAKPAAKSDRKRKRKKSSAPSRPADDGLLGSADEVFGESNSLEGFDSSGGNFGLGTSGAGRGGGGTNTGGFGVGTFGTAGRGGGGRGGRDYGKGSSLGDKSVSRPKLKPGRPEVKGSLDKRIIRKVVNQNKRQVKACYEKELAKTHGLAGKIVVKWTINTSGGVASAVASSNTMGSKAVETCLAKSIKQWRFPAPKGGGIVIVSYPFVFEAGSGAGAPAIAPVSLEAQISALEENTARTDWETADLAGLYLAAGRTEDAEKLLLVWLKNNEQRGPSERLNVLGRMELSALLRPQRIALAKEILDNPADAGPGMGGWSPTTHATRILIDDVRERGALSELETLLMPTQRLDNGAAAEALRQLQSDEERPIADKLLAGWQKAYGDQFIIEVTSDWALRSPFGAARFDALSNKLTAAPTEIQLIEDMLSALPLDDEGRQKSAQVAIEKACSEGGATMNQCENWLRKIYDDKRAESLITTLRTKRLDNMASIRAHDVGNIDLIEEFVGSLRLAGRDAEADRLSSERVEFAPHDYNIRLGYAQALVNESKPVKACREYGVAVQLNPAARNHFRDMMAERRKHGVNVAESIRECIVQGVSNLPVNRSISLILTWEDSTADVDLHIREVGGHHVFYRSRESANGGLLYYDIRDGYGPEIYVLGSGPAGEYELSLVYFAGSAPGVSGTLTVLRNAGSASETREDFPFTLKGPSMEEEQPVTKFTIQ